jgi:hypothetical protein
MKLKLIRYKGFSGILQRSIFVFSIEGKPHITKEMMISIIGIVGLISQHFM